MKTLDHFRHTRPPDRVAQNSGPVPVESRLAGRILRYAHAFTLLELLVVISILGLIAAIAMPVLNNFKPNYTANTTRTLLDELSRARQLAISQRTTVYMVFVPTNFWNDANYPVVASDPVEKAKMDKLLDKQLIGYSFVSLRSMGDQPGSPTVRYLSAWKPLPEGAFIALSKFGDFAPPPISTNDFNGNRFIAFPVQVFPKTTKVPFPSEFARRGRPVTPYIKLPYLAFDYMGRLVRFDDQTGQQLRPANEIIPIAKGNIAYARDQVTKAPIAALPNALENPPGNSTNAYNLVSIDWVTGRARGIQQEVR